MRIAVIGATFVDIKGFPSDSYIPTGRNVGRVEYIHGGVARNVVEDIANVELRPIFLGIVDDTPMGRDVVQKLQNHKVNTDYVLTRPDGMGTWLAVFDNNGDVAGSISKRPNMLPVADLFLCGHRSRLRQGNRKADFGAGAKAQCKGLWGSFQYEHRFQAAGFSEIL